MPKTEPKHISMNKTTNVSIDESVISDKIEQQILLTQQNPVASLVTKGTPITSIEVTDYNEELVFAKETSPTKNKILNDKIIQDVVIEIVTAYKPKSIIKISKLLNDRGFFLSDHKIRNLLTEANIHKSFDDKGQKYYKLQTEATFINTNNVINNFITSIDHNDSMIVIKTTIAGAPLVAKLIDFNSSQLSVLGTIAGDDTVLVIPKNAITCYATFEKVYNFLNKK